MNRQYIGARYVPKFDGTFNMEKVYNEPLTIVEYNDSSYISKKPVPLGTLPTNTEYWALAGTTSGQIRDLQNRVGTVEDELIKKENKLYSKRILFVGDSFGQRREYTTDNKVFIDLLEDIGLDCINISVNGAGFTISNNMFIDQITNYNGDRESITDIVVFGGINDVSSEASTTTLSNKIAEFCNYAKSNYPNAQILMVFLGTDIGSSIGSARTKRLEYVSMWKNACATNGAIYVDNGQWILASKSMLHSDGVHPNTKGQHEIAKYMISAIATHTINVVRSITSVFTLRDNHTLNMFENQHNNIITLLPAQYDYPFDNDASIKTNGGIDASGRALIGTFDDNNLIIGTRESLGVCTNYTGFYKASTDSARVVASINWFSKLNEIYVGIIRCTQNTILTETPINIYPVKTQLIFDLSCNLAGYDN